MITPLTCSSKSSYFCLIAPVIFLLASAATFDPLSYILFWLALVSAGMLVLVFAYLMIAGELKLVSLAGMAGLLLALLIPLDSISLRLIQIRANIDVAFHGEIYKKDARKSGLTEGSANWTIGHQHLREYRLFYAENPQIFQGKH